MIKQQNLIVDPHAIKKYRKRAFCYQKTDEEIAEHLMNIAKNGKVAGSRVGALQLCHQNEYILVIKKNNKKIIKTFLGDITYKKWCKKHDQIGRQLLIY